VVGSRGFVNDIIADDLVSTESSHALSGNLSKSVTYVSYDTWTLNVSKLMQVQIQCIENITGVCLCAHVLWL